MSQGPWLPLDRGGRKALLLIGGGKVLFWLLILALLLFDSRYNEALHRANNVVISTAWPQGEAICLESRLATWDAGHYLSLAAIWSGRTGSDWEFLPYGRFSGVFAEGTGAGYHQGSPRVAFYPLWPALLTPVSWGFGQRAAFVWALILANLLSVVAFWILYGHYRAQSDHGTALLTLGFVMASPGAIFFSLNYTESLFLTLAVLVLRSLAQHQYGICLIASFLLPLTKAIGWLILVPLVVHGLQRRLNLSWARIFCLLLAPIAGYSVYFLIVGWCTGNPFEGFVAQSHYTNQPSVAQIFDILGFLNAFVDVRAVFHPSGGLVDRLAFLIFVSGLVLAWRFRREDFWWGSMVGLIPALSNQLLSYSRFVVVCVPVYLGLANAMRMGVRPLPWMAVTWILLIALQVVAIARYLRFEWVG